MQQQSTMTTVGHRSSPNRMARMIPYRFVHPGLAGEPTGPDLAKPDQIRPSSFFFFCELVCVDNPAANKIVLKMLWTSENFDSKSTVIYTILSIHWYCMCNF
jgi:hypothetical protein